MDRYRFNLYDKVRIKENGREAFVVWMSDKHDSYLLETIEEPKEVLFFKHDEFEKGEEPKSL